jgi:glycolate oxidase iron-sulfur subunit
MRNEGGVARGKLMLFSSHREGKLGYSKHYRFFLTACLLCGSCTQGCPNDVDTPALVRAARAELVRKKKSGWLRHFILNRILPSRRGLPVLLRGARFSRALWARRIPKESGLHIRFLRGPGKTRRRIPGLARPFYLERNPPSNWTGEGMRVGLFVGCLSNYMRPQAAEATVKVLEQLGVSVAAPRDQACCGLPAFAAGEERAARRLAYRNLEAFSPGGAPLPDVITTPCASCAMMLKEHMLGLLEDDPAAREFSARVVPFSQLWRKLAEQRGLTAKNTDGSGPALTYHDPCHLSRGFGEKDAPREALTSLAGARFVEMSHPCKCCGHGGAFNISHYDLSLAIAKTKVDNILASGAELLVTECSGCLLQLSETLGKVSPDFEVITTPEALYRFSAPSE